MTRSKNKNKKKGPQKSSEASSSKEVNLDQIIDEADAAVNCFNYEEAGNKLKEVLCVDGNNLKALERLAAVHIEQSNWLEADELFKKCIQLSPDIGYEKYFSIAQLHEGEEALKFYQKGIQILEKDLENSENVLSSKNVDKKALSRCLSDAYCSVSEIFMTDCCFMQDAEEMCHSAVESAIKTDPSNSEAFQCLANFHLNKEQISEAKEDMQKSLALWLPHHEALRDGEVQASDAEEIEDLIPAYESRIQTSKLLIELEMFDDASNILDGLIEEDDEVPEVWYLLGWMNYIQGDEYKPNAHYFLNKAKVVSAKIGLENADYISHAKELVKELQEAFPLEESEGEQEELGSDFESDNEMET